MKLIKKPFSINGDRLYAMIYFSVGSALLEGIEKGFIKISDKRVLNALERVDKLYQWIVTYKLENKHRKQIKRLYHQMLKTNKFVDTQDEFENLFTGYCMLWFVAEAFKTIPEIKFSCCYAMGLIKKVLVERYHVSKRPEMKEKIINCVVDVLLSLEEEGFVDLKKLKE